MKRPFRILLAIAYILYIILVLAIWAHVLRNWNHENATGSLNAQVGPSDIYPNGTRTPGVALITSDADAQKTICNKSWSTKSIRPSSNYTTALKIKQIKEYGYQDTNPTHYEEDHLISLELGGNPTSPQNLWPEPYTASIATGGAKAKDAVENYLHKKVCAGAITLQEAQRLVTTDWYAMYIKMSATVNVKLGGAEVIGIDVDDN